MWRWNGLLECFISISSNEKSSHGKEGGKRLYMDLWSDHR